MRQHILTFSHVAQCLSNQVPVMLLYVVESRGSSPGREGFCMAVDNLGGMQGSIGGGIMEHKFVELARKRLLEDATNTDVYLQLHDKTPATHQSGMICSGEQTLILYRPTVNDLPAIQHYLSALAAGRTGTLEITPAAIHYRDEAPGAPDAWQVLPGDKYRYLKRTGPRYHLYIIGGGHCALALSELAASLDFQVHVFDTREGLHTMGQITAAQHKRYLADYAALAEQIPGGANHFVIIMTFGYRTDAQALRALRGKKFAYLGMMGSQYKSAKLLEELVAEGWDLQAQPVQAPAGVQIKSQTPGEIAVSIAAALIQVRNRDLA